MHEASIIEAVLERACEETRRAGAHRIERIRLRVGVLAGVVPEALRFAFDALREGTPAAQATLEIEDAPATFRCLECRHTLESHHLDFTCPACGGALAVDSGGQQLELTQLEVT
jgi:hydrogenase nickel incorporation protein HypA/HybF